MLARSCAEAIDIASAVRTRGLTRDFGKLRAVDHLDLDVPRGIVFGFLAPNGGGKTTTIRLLLGLLEPTSGTAEVLGHDIISEAGVVRAKCGALLEHSGLYERLSAYENLAFHARAYRMEAKASDARVKELLQHVGLWERRDERVGTWSRGQKQKVAVARALLPRPELVFLDEPTAGLDVPSAVTLREDLARVARTEGATIFLTTHNMSEAERLCDRVAVVRAGKVLTTGTPSELGRRRAGARVEILGSGFTDALAAALTARAEVAGVEIRADRIDVELVQPGPAAGIVRAVVEAGASVEEVRRGGESLEDVFLELVKEDPA